MSRPRPMAALYPRGSRRRCNATPKTRERAMNELEASLDFSKPLTLPSPVPAVVTDKTPKLTNVSREGAAEGRKKAAARAGQDAKRAAELEAWKATLSPKKKKLTPEQRRTSQKSFWQETPDNAEDGPVSSFCSSRYRPKTKPRVFGSVLVNGVWKTAKNTVQVVKKTVTESKESSTKRSKEKRPPKAVSKLKDPPKDASKENRPPKTVYIFQPKEPTKNLSKEKSQQAKAVSQPKEPPKNASKEKPRQAKTLSKLKDPPNSPSKESRPPKIAPTAATFSLMDDDDSNLSFDDGLPLMDEPPLRPHASAAPPPVTQPTHTETTQAVLYNHSKRDPAQPTWPSNQKDDPSKSRPVVQAPTISQHSSARWFQREFGRRSLLFAPAALSKGTQTQPDSPSPAKRSAPCHDDSKRSAKKRCLEYARINKELAELQQKYQRLVQEKEVHLKTIGELQNAQTELERAKAEEFASLQATLDLTKADLSTSQAELSTAHAARQQATQELELQRTVDQQKEVLVSATDFLALYRKCACDYVLPIHKSTKDALVKDAVNKHLTELVGELGNMIRAHLPSLSAYDEVKTLSRESLVKGDTGKGIKELHATLTKSIKDCERVMDVCRQSEQPILTFLAPDKELASVFLKWKRLTQEILEESMNEHDEYPSPKPIPPLTNITRPDLTNNERKAMRKILAGRYLPAARKSTTSSHAHTA